MKIFVMPLARDGCSHYRIHKPYKAMNDDGIIFFEASDLETSYALKYLEECDYVLCRQGHAGAIKKLDPIFKSDGRKLSVILDMDDYIFDIDPYSEVYELYGTKEVKHGDQWLWKDGVNINIKKNIELAETIKAFIRRADILTVSTERLKEKFKEYNNNIIVVPNAIDPKDWVVPNFKERDNLHNEFRVGWTGGISHYSDWYEIKDDIEKIAKEFPQVKFVIGGVKFDGIFKNIKNLEYWDWVDATGHGFRTAMMDLDLAIIPLKDSEFNANKSCIKFYEFSSLKVPTICSNVAPYSDEAPKESLTNNFYETIKDYLENKTRATEMAEKNFNWVSKNRNQDKISKELYKKLSKALQSILRDKKE